MSLARGAARDKGAKRRSALGRLLRMLRPHAAALSGAVLCGALSVALAVAAPRALGEATNILFEGAVSSAAPAGASQEQVVRELIGSGQDDLARIVSAMERFVPGEGVDFAALGMVLSVVAALYVASSLLLWAQGTLVNLITVRVVWGLRRQVEAKLHRLPLRYLDGVPRGEIISRVTNDIDNINQTLQQTLTQVLTSILTLIGVFAMMMSISWQLTLVVLITLPLVAIVVGVVGPRSRKAFRAQWQHVGRINTQVEESVSGHTLIKVYGRGQSASESFRDENEELFEKSFVAQFLAGTIQPVTGFIGNLAYVGVAVVGAAMVAGGQMRLGDLQAFIQYSQQFTQPLAQLGGMFAIVQSTVASAERVFEVLDAPSESPDPMPRPPLATGGGEIEFQDVAFSYERGRPLIEGLSFAVDAGQTVAIVGPSGAGKSTLVNLIMRFYELDRGRILLNGQDISEIGRPHLRAQTGMVLQDPWLFAGTIRENIRYGHADATDGEVEAAARATYVDRFVSTLPDGYDTVLDEDASSLSAGEKQLITIARAFIAQPSVLILDEATSAVDTRTELLLQEAMAALRRGRTAFVIAHRLSTIRDADVILVMENGAVVEQGAHHELLAAGGLYTRLHRAQFGEGGG